MLIDESAKDEVCHIIHPNPRLTPGFFLRPTCSSQMANSCQTHNLSLKYKFHYWFAMLFYNVMIDQMLIALVCSFASHLMQDNYIKRQGIMRRRPKKRKEGRSHFSCHRNNSLHFLQGLLQILGN